MRDLVTIATLLRENQTDIKNAALAVRNATDNLARAQEILNAHQQQRLDLRAEHAAAEEAGYESALGLGRQTSDIAVLEALNVPVTSSDQTRIFNGAHD